MVCTVWYTASRRGLRSLPATCKRYSAASRATILLTTKLCAGDLFEIHAIITNSALKKLQDLFLGELLQVGNATLALQQFPETWKRANVVIIPKGAKATKFSQNCMPISLPSDLSSVIEAVISWITRGAVQISPVTG